MTTTTRRFGVEIEFIGVQRLLLAETMTAGGVECRVENYNHTTHRNRWKIVPDSSVNGSIITNPARSESYSDAEGSTEFGGELVSPPMNDIEALRKAVRLASGLGATVNASCGLHVHVDAGDFGMPDFKRLLKLWCVCETAIFQLIPPSRRLNSYSKPVLAWLRRTMTPSEQRASAARGRYDVDVPTKTLPQVFKAIDSLERIQDYIDVMQRGNRYMALNLQSFTRHGTIEMRLHSGTVNAAKVCNWVQLMVVLVEMAKDVNYAIPVDVLSLEGFFQEITRFTELRAQPVSAPEPEPSYDFDPRVSTPHFPAPSADGSVTSAGALALRATHPPPRGSGPKRMAYDLLMTLPNLTRNEFLLQCAERGINGSTASNVWYEHRTHPLQEAQRLLALSGEIPQPTARIERSAVFNRARAARSVQPRIERESVMGIVNYYRERAMEFVAC